MPNDQSKMITVSNPAKAVVTAAAIPNLGPEEVHVFAARLDSSLVSELRLILSPDELERADRFVFSPDRERFVVVIEISCETYRLAGAVIYRDNPCV